ncbi:MAG: laccase domain-containing protein, partial [bacterium]|nr:laccase domain-containing protein [bacterium]
MFTLFRDPSWMRYGLSEKNDGFMNVKTVNDPARDAVALENRRRFFEREGAAGNIFIPYLVHGNEVRLVSDENWQEMPRADGFVTKTPGVVLTITVADCFPLYFCDPVQKAIGLAHSGWRGTVRNILGNMV